MVGKPGTRGVTLKIQIWARACVGAGLARDAGTQCVSHTALMLSQTSQLPQLDPRWVSNPR
ncbi:hypothetical protein FW764_10785 [Pseudomonas sp. 1152_12]